ncbi:hypothetical protein HYPSUDRAFT_72003 [Hypholoma sublateritium FD-334 SS-4]|uniref:Nephrocystin 3-like N-terminal domain-containing protein n=1 Tax=Hypholoma sublateritium (strain FD-334 SS-4) TaxID=945553 RepID=A0A0D2KLI9_HYPSF|nr:hypothetical protein HYPSUDRAFT_72003 [Hypholoma sublateritium FD-334 SS-4]
MLATNAGSVAGQGSSMFMNAQRPTIIDSSFHIIHGDAYINNNAAAHKPAPSGIEMLQDHVITAAFHNAPCALYDAPKCLPRTREVVQNVIMDWVGDSSNPALFLWLHGPAGSGKSSIAHTIANICDEKDCLGGTFFFSGQAPELKDDDRKTNFIATIAYQLAQHMQFLDAFVRQAVCDDPLIFTRSLDVQLRSLIINPLNSAAASTAFSYEFSKPRVVIIDALDESRHPAAQRYILNMLHDALYTSNPAHRLIVPGFLRFLITSRPERHIRNTFSVGNLSNHTITLPLDDRYCPKEDILLALEAGFQEIRASHPRRFEIHENWPSKRHLEELAKKSSGQFIYSVTVMKYIQSPSNNPIERLNNILSKTTGFESDTPFAGLDAVYHKIFSAVQDTPQALEILFFSMQDWAVPLEASWHDVFGYSWGDIHTALVDLHALLNVPDTPGQIQFHHGSLVDFLCDKNRSKKYHLYSPDMRTRYAKQWIKYLSSQPYANDSGRRHDVLEKLLEDCQHSPRNHELTDALLYFTHSKTEYTRFRNYGIHQAIQDFIDSKPLPERLLKENGLRLYRQEYVGTTWFVAHLAKYPDRTRSHLLVAVTFPELFLRYSMQLYYAVFSLHLDRDDSRKIKALFSAFHIYIRDLDTEEWTELLSSAYDYLRVADSSESGSSGTNKEIYTAFAYDLTQCLSLGRGTDSALVFLPEILPMAAANKELAELLHSVCFGEKTGSAVLPDRSNIRDFIRASWRYISRCSITFPTQSRRGSTVTLSSES